MPMSWEQYIEMEEAANYGACQEHAAEFGIFENTENYMERHGYDGCDQMPCRRNCPLIKEKKTND